MTIDYICGPNGQDITPQQFSFSRHRPAIEDYRENVFTINAFIPVIDA
jgi:hypothetical protein